MQLGKLLDDPIMAAFRKDFRKQAQQNWASLRERMGLTLDDLRGVPTSEAAIALIEPQPGRGGHSCPGRRDRPSQPGQGDAEKDGPNMASRAQSEHRGRRRI